MIPFLDLLHLFPLAFYFFIPEPSFSHQNFVSQTPHRSQCSPSNPRPGQCVLGLVHECEVFLSFLVLKRTAGYLRPPTPPSGALEVPLLTCGLVFLIHFLVFFLLKVRSDPSVCCGSAWPTTASSAFVKVCASFHAFLSLRDSSSRSISLLIRFPVLDPDFFLSAAIERHDFWAVAFMYFSRPFLVVVCFKCEDSPVFFVLFFSLARYGASVDR